jgi:hypothetical protein
VIPEPNAAEDTVAQIPEPTALRLIAAARRASNRPGRLLACPLPHPMARARIRRGNPMGKTTATLAIALACGAALAGSAPAVASGELCDYGVVRDYARPLERLPHIRELPPAEHLPFAPARVFLNHQGGQLFVGGGEVGYRLSFSPYFQGHRLSPPLNWVVEARYVRVDARGRPTQVRGHIVRRVKRLRSDEGEPSGTLEFLFKVGRPALYRLEISFAELSGKRLARFGEYLRVLKPKFDAHLSLNGSVFHPGERVLASIDNYGTTSLSFGLERTIEYLNGTSWEQAPNSSQGSVLLPVLRAGPGASAGCWGFTIPPEEPPGTYRFVVSPQSSRPGLSRDSGEPLTLTSEFQIVGPG